MLHVESGRGASVNAGDWFPLMSAYKLPIAIHALRAALVVVAFLKASGGTDASRAGVARAAHAWA